MIPVVQQTNRDCFTACLASILELPLEALPTFQWDDPKWLDVYRNFLRQYGLDIVWTPQTQAPAGWSIRANAVPGQERGHCVVCYDGVLTHDTSKTPKPLGEVKHWFVITMLDLRWAIEKVNEGRA